MTELRVPIKRELRDELDAAAVARMWSRIDARGRAQSRHTPGRKLVLAVAGVACAVVVTVIAWPRTDQPRRGPVALASGESWGTEDAKLELQVSLNDGSRITLAAGSLVEPLANSDSEVVLKQTRGDVTYDIAPHGPRRWTIECGAVSVEVIGTSFRIDRNAQRVHVEVMRGIVLVRGADVPDHVMRLTAGMHADVPNAALAIGRSAPPPAAASDAVATAGAQGPQSPEAHAEPPVRSMARAHDAAEPAHTQPAHDAAATAATPATVDGLLALADVARISGHPADAVDPLERILADHADDPRAPLAALTLGRIQLRSLGEPARAARALQRAVALRLPEGLEEDASALLIEALSRAGDVVAARQAYDQFVARFPDSPRRNELQPWIRDR
jgi:transmembrane sensor